MLEQLNKYTCCLCVFLFLCAGVAFNCVACIHPYTICSLSCVPCKYKIKFSWELFATSAPVGEKAGPCVLVAYIIHQQTLVFFGASNKCPAFPCNKRNSLYQPKTNLNLFSLFSTAFFF